MVRPFRRKDPEAPFALDVDAAMRTLGGLHSAGKLTISAPIVVEASRCSPPAPQERREVSWSISDDDHTLVSGRTAEVDHGQARRLAGALTHRLGRRLRLTYTATSTFTPTPQETT